MTNQVIFSCDYFRESILSVNQRCVKCNPHQWWRKVGREEKWYLLLSFTIFHPSLLIHAFQGIFEVKEMYRVSKIKPPKFVGRLLMVVVVVAGSVRLSVYMRTCCGAVFGRRAGLCSFCMLISFEWRQMALLNDRPFQESLAAEVNQKPDKLFYTPNHTMTTCLCI